MSNGYYSVIDKSTNTTAFHGSLDDCDAFLGRKAQAIGKYTCDDIYIIEWTPCEHPCEES